MTATPQREVRQLACGTIRAGKLTLYRIDEAGNRVRMTPDEIDHAIEDARRRRRRLFTRPAPPTELARILGLDATADTSAG